MCTFSVDIQHNIHDFCVVELNQKQQNHSQIDGQDMGFIDDHNLIQHQNRTQISETLPDDVRSGYIPEIVHTEEREIDITKQHVVQEEHHSVQQNMIQKDHPKEKHTCNGFGHDDKEQKRRKICDQLDDNIENEQRQKKTTSVLGTQLCTCCHRIRNSVQKYYANNYDFSDDIVEKAFSIHKRLSTTSEEFICGICHKNLYKRTLKRIIPMSLRQIHKCAICDEESEELSLCHTKSVTRQSLCTCCHRMMKSVVVFDPTRYDFSNVVVQTAFSIHKRLPTTSKEFICKHCYKQLSKTKLQPNIPRYLKSGCNCNFCGNTDLSQKSAELSDELYTCVLCGVTYKNMLQIVYSSGLYDLNNHIVLAVVANMQNFTSGRVCRKCDKHLSSTIRITMPPQLPQCCCQDCVSFEKSTILQKAIVTFHKKIREMPNYVCHVCHQMFFHSQVGKLHRSKYTVCELTRRAFEHVPIVNIHQEEFICRTCKKWLMKRDPKLPPHSVANGLVLDVIPEELQGLCDLERRLLSKRIPFMKLVSLPRGKQYGIRGPCVNVPAKLDAVCDLLPRLPGDAQMVHFKLKRRLRYKGHHMVEKIRPQKVLTALYWLKEHNPHYKDVVINTNWESAYLNDNVWKYIIERGDQENCSDNDCNDIDSGDKTVDQHVDQDDGHQIVVDNDEYAHNGMLFFTIYHFLYLYM